MPITFAVDEVAPASEPAPTVGIAELVGKHLHVGIAGQPRMLAVKKAAPLLAAVHHAFAEHRPLVLSPDAVWVTIAQGVAQHVRLHSEALRPRLVRHRGKELIQIDVMRDPDPADWASIVGTFRARLGERVGEGMGRLMTCDFSTSGPAERTASEIVLMDMMSPYFDYAMYCVCGIPSITLLGTPADWRTIRERIEVIAELDLGWWTKSLAKIADRLVAAAKGRPDREFFRGIYKPRKAYGPERIVGWAARLYPYVGNEGRYDERNPLLGRALDAPLKLDAHGEYAGPSITLNEVPSCMAQAVVRMHFADGRPERRIALDGGLIGVEQDAKGALVPRVGYVVRDAGASLAAVVEKLRAGHHTTPGSDQPRWSGDANLRAFFAEIGEATLFEGQRAWRLLPPDQRVHLMLYPISAGSIRSEKQAVRVIDLPDRTTLAICNLDRDHRVVRLRIDDLVPNELPEVVVDEETATTIHISESPFFKELPRWKTREPVTAIPVMQGSLLDVLDRALASGGRLDLPTDGTVLDHARELRDGG